MPTSLPLSMCFVLQLRFWQKHPKAWWYINQKNIHIFIRIFFFFRLTDNRQKFHSYIHSHREKQKAISEYLTFLSDGRTDGLICKDQINAASSSLDLFVVVQQMFDESIYLTSTREAVKNQINKKISQHLLSFTVQLLF